MSKEQEPLLSEEQMQGIAKLRIRPNEHPRWKESMLAVREIYESARSKDTDLIKDMLPYMQHAEGCHMLMRYSDAWRDTYTQFEKRKCTCGLVEVLQRINDLIK